MLRKFSIRQTLIVILLAILFGGASLTNLGSSEFPLDPSIARLRFLMIGVSLLILMLMSGFDMWRIPNKPIPLSFLWILFSFVVFLSGYTNENLTTIRDSMWLMVAVPMIFFYALPKLMNKSANLFIALGLLLGISPYIFLSFLLNPIWQSNYKIYRGIFANSNQLGFTTAIMSSSVFILLVGTLFAKRSFLEKLALNVLLIICLIVILLSNARTSLIAFLCMFLIMIFKLFQKPKNIFMTLIGNGAIAAILFSLGEQSSWLSEQIVKIQEKDSVSGRDYIWNQTIVDMKLLGNGGKYFEENFGIGAHNTIIDILGINGLLASIVMVFFALISFCYAFSYFKEYAKVDPYASTPLVITTCFWILSMGEGMFGSLGNAMTLAYMLSIGVIMSKSQTGRLQQDRKLSL